MSEGSKCSDEKVGKDGQGLGLELNTVARDGFTAV